MEPLSRWRKAARSSQELIGSMRFAIALLSLIAVSSIIGTILKQQEPYPNYVNQFGPFWAAIFRSLGLYEVYTTWWFVLILAFLVASVSLCLIRNAPKMIADANAWKEHVQEGGMRALHHHFDFAPKPSLTLDIARASLQDLLVKDGFTVKAKKIKDDELLILAKKGSASKWGYILAHGAIVLICLGGLLDGDLATRAQIWWGGKEYLPASLETAKLSDIPAKHKISTSNPSYRANLFVPEGQKSSVAFINGATGQLLQELPFSVQLKQFKVDYYSTGMPKLFSSEVVVTDLATGKEREALIKVNEPLNIDGVAIYQSSFEDGGSSVALRPYSLEQYNFSSRQVSPLLRTTVGGSFPLKNFQGGDAQLEVTGFKLINVENMTNADSKPDARGVAVQGKENFSHMLSNHLGSGAKVATPKELRNVGPAVQYKIRDASGQAKEYNNYMQPLVIDGQSFYLAGVRDVPNEPFKYLRIPTDEKGGLDEWLAMKSLLNDPVIRKLAAAKFAASAIQGLSKTSKSPLMQSQLESSALRALNLFAGNRDAGQVGGLVGMGAFIEKTVPVADRQVTAEVLLKILNGSMWEVWREARHDLGLAAPANNEESVRFMQSAIVALSDASFYSSPVLFQLAEFKEVKASVFQVTKSPGKKWVYVGSLMLVLGIFAMFYLPERRIWIRLKGGSKVQGLFAMTTNRQTLDFENEYTKYRNELQV